MVAQDAEAVEGGGFDAEDDRAEGHRLQAGGAELAVFVRGEVAFRADPEGGVGGTSGSVGVQGGRQRLGVGLERGDERQGEISGRERRQGVRKRQRRVDAGEPVLTALFAGFDGEALPFCFAAAAIIRIEPDHGAMGEERDDFGGTEFNGFFDDPIDGRPFGNGDSQSETCGGGRRFTGRTELELDFFFRGRRTTAAATRPRPSNTSSASPGCTRMTEVAWRDSNGSSTAGSPFSGQAGAGRKNRI